MGQPSHGNFCFQAIHAKRVTIMPKDIQLVRRIRGERAWADVGSFSSTNSRCTCLDAFLNILRTGTVSLFPYFPDQDNFCWIYGLFLLNLCTFSSRFVFKFFFTFFLHLCTFLTNFQKFVDCMDWNYAHFFATDVCALPLKFLKSLPADFSSPCLSQILSSTPDSTALLLVPCWKLRDWAFFKIV